MALNRFETLFSLEVRRDGTPDVIKVATETSHKFDGVVKQLEGMGFGSIPIVQIDITTQCSATEPNHLDGAVGYVGAWKPCRALELAPPKHGEIDVIIGDDTMVKSLVPPKDRLVRSGSDLVWETGYKTTLARMEKLDIFEYLCRREQERASIVAPLYGDLLPEAVYNGEGIIRAVGNEWSRPNGWMVTTMRGFRRRPLTIEELEIYVYGTDGLQKSKRGWFNAERQIPTDLVECDHELLGWLKTGVPLEVLRKMPNGTMWQHPLFLNSISSIKEIPVGAPGFRQEVHNLVSALRGNPPERAGVVSEIIYGRGCGFDTSGVFDAGSVGLGGISWRSIEVL